MLEFISFIISFIIFISLSLNLKISFNVVICYWGVVALAHFVTFVSKISKKDVKKESYIIDEDKKDIDDVMEDLRKNSFKYEVNKINYTQTEEEKTRIKYLRILEGIDE